MRAGRGVRGRPSALRLRLEEGSGIGDASCSGCHWPADQLAPVPAASAAERSRAHSPSPSPSTGEGRGEGEGRSEKGDAPRASSRRAKLPLRAPQFKLSKIAENRQGLVTGVRAGLPPASYVLRPVSRPRPNSSLSLACPELVGRDGTEPACSSPSPSGRGPR